MKQDIKEVIKNVFKQYLYEAEGLSKPYLLKLTNNDQTKFKEFKKKAVRFLNRGGFNTLFPKGQNDNIYQSVANFVTRLAIKGQQMSNQDLRFLHDLKVQNKLPVFVDKKLKEPEYTLQNLRTDRREYHSEKQKQKSSGLRPEQQKKYNRVKLIKKFDNDMGWVIPLDEAGKEQRACRLTGKLGGHCGNVPGQRLGGTMYVLRPLNKVGVFVTMVLSTQGKIRERKGNYNNKPNVKQFGQQLLWFVNQPFVKGFDEQGRYAPQKNFHVTDLMQIMDDNRFNELIKRKPELLTDYDEVMLKYKKQNLSNEQIFEILMKGQITLRQRLGLGL